MAEIFLSYSHNDADQARKTAAALETRGWSVWWDPEIRSGQSFISLINEEISAASCVVVLWSKTSVASRWVLEEALNGLNRGILCPVLIERGPQLPVGFASIKYVEITDWRGKEPVSGFGPLIAEIERLLGSPQPSKIAAAPVDRELATAVVTEPARPADSKLTGSVEGTRSRSRATMQDSYESVNSRDGFIDFSDLSLMDYPVVALLFAVFVWLLQEIISRFVFSSPLASSFEISMFLSAGIAVLGGSIAVRNNRGIRSPISASLSRILGTVGTSMQRLLSLGVYGIMTYFLAREALDKFATGEKSMLSTAALPLWPVYGVFVIAFALMVAFSFFSLLRGLMNKGTS